MDKIRVRFAPSPTGYLHIGGFRTALYNFLFARKNNGTFILRIEDTDRKRFVEGGIENIIISLRCFFDWDEGIYWDKFPEINREGRVSIKHKGGYGPYIQSERLDVYKKYAEQLVKEEKAYYCFCTPERLEKMRQEQISKKKAPMYDRRCIKLSQDEIKKKLESGEKYVIRQKINTEGITEVDDLIRGKVSFENKLLDDQILLKSDGYPTYNFANVIDDHLMEISHIIRGEEFISSTPKFIQLYDNFDWDKPKFAHLPLLLNTDRTKLSKRKGDVAVEDYIKKGYLEEAIINFVALLGWNPGKGSTQEIFSLKELIEKFDLEKVHKAGAVFDLKKLDWLNSRYIQKLSIDELYEKSLEFLKKKDFYKNAPPERKEKKYVKKVLSIERERLNNFSEAGEGNKFLFQDIEYDLELLRWKKMSDANLKISLDKSKEILFGIGEEKWTRIFLEKIFLETPPIYGGAGKGELLWPLRVALTGEKKSPPPFEVAWALGKKECLKRIDAAIAKLAD